MNLETIGTLRRAFRGSSEPSYREMLLRHQRDESERRERKEEAEKDVAEENMDFVVAVVSVAEMNEFRAELDLYDAATIAALQQSEQELADARERLDKLFAKAHILPDGRRVFKTEDGLQVFDEFGVELDKSVIDPDVIEDWRPRWGVTKTAIADYKASAEKHAQNLGFQEKLDEARERLDSGEITRQEFDDLRNELKADMPEDVRDQLPELEQEQDAAAEADAAPAEELDISDDMVPATSKPSGLTFDR